MPFPYIFSHVSVIKHTFRAPFSILNPVPYRIFRVDSEFNTPRALGALFRWVFNESLKMFQYFLHILTFFQNYFTDFIIYIKNYADSDFDILLNDLYHIRLHIFSYFLYFFIFWGRRYSRRMAHSDKYTYITVPSTV